ncbi:MAG: hypothetical protein KAY37_14140, partial [Phycisphaerae bacterium]|nr:hypothetical protein [Phycisphaerae bacterium]
NGTEPPADSIVRATTAICLWHHDVTTVGYLDAVYAPSATRNDRKPYTVRGHYLWPDFATIGIKDPEIITQQAKMSFSSATGDDCEAECRLKYLKRIRDCHENRDEHEDECYALHGPSEQSTGDPDAFVTCMNEAGEYFHLCLTNAARRLNNCLELCYRPERGMQPPGE